MRLTKEDIARLRERLLETMPDEIREIAQALRNPDNSADELPANRELVAAVDDLTSRLRLELAAFSQVFNAEDYHGRFLVYQQNQHGGKPGWSLVQIEYAGSRVMEGDAGHLRSLAEHMLDRCDEPSIALWVTPAPAPSGVTLYFLYARHSEGHESVFLLHDDALHRLPLTGKQLDTSLALVAPAVSRERGFWKHIMESLSRMAGSELKPGLEKHLLDTHQLTLTDELWSELLKHFYLNVDFMRFQMEVARSVTTPVLQESQVLLGTFVEGLERASALFEERLEQARRDHKRELKRRVSDYDKLDVAHKGLQQRAQRQAEDLAQLKQAAPATRTAGVAGPAALGQTLKHFF